MLFLYIQQKSNSSAARGLNLAHSATNRNREVAVYFSHHYLKQLPACDKIINSNPKNNILHLSAFFDIVSYIEQGILNYAQPNNNNHIPKDLDEIIAYVNKNFSSINTVNEMAEFFHISQSTMERMFKKYLSVTPRTYLYDKKFSNACRLLRNNCSVTEACFQSGFNDYSNFIQKFKQIYKTTPLKYKRSMQ